MFPRRFWNFRLVADAIKMPALFSWEIGRCSLSLTSARGSLAQISRDESRQSWTITSGAN
jgi:hypothetical protein